jgi:hypothetical protein
MMKRTLIAALLSLFSTPVFAGVSCTLPFNLTNGTIADATQVMANYNALVTCLTNAAAAGSNSDITALLGLTTPLALNEGGTPVYIGGTSGGSANAQTITTVPPFIASAGNVMRFKAGASNTGPLTVNGFNVFRRSQLGATMSVGGEIYAGEMVDLEYDGTELQCLSCGRVFVGSTIDITGPTAPAGYLIGDGTCVSQTTYADLFAYYGSADIWSPGSTGGACSAGLFHLPFTNGSVAAAYDSQGAAVANKLTNAGSSCAATGVAVNCGAQNRTLAQANLGASWAFPLTATAAGQTTTFLQDAVSTGGAQVVPCFSGSGCGPSTGPSTAASSSVSGNASSNGSAAPVITVQPTYTVITAIKF